MDCLLNLIVATLPQIVPFCLPQITWSACIQLCIFPLLSLTWLIILKDGSTAQKLVYLALCLLPSIKKHIFGPCSSSEEDKNKEPGGLRGGVNVLLRVLSLTWNDRGTLTLSIEAKLTWNSCWHLLTCLSFSWEHCPLRVCLFTGSPHQVRTVYLPSFFSQFTVKFFYNH